MAWERRRDRRAVLPQTLAVAEFHVGGHGLDGPGRNESHGDRAAPCVWAVEAHDDKGLLVQAAPQSPAVAGPKTAGGHWLQPDDAGAGMIWTVRQIPACGLQPVAKSSWRRSRGGPFGPAGGIHPRRTPFAHDKGV